MHFFCYNMLYGWFYGKFVFNGGSHYSYVAVSLENVLLDVKELQRGMDLTRRENSMHGHNSLLKDFIHHNEARLKKLLDDARIAQVEKKIV